MDACEVVDSNSQVTTNVCRSVVRHSWLGSVQGILACNWNWVLICWLLWSGWS